MSDILEKFNVFREISEEVKRNIKLFNVFDDKYGKSVLFVTKEDKVFACGFNTFGKLGVGHRERVDTPTEIPELNGKQIKQFFIGETFVLALNEENHVFGWGWNYSGQLGRGYISEECLKPEIIPDLENIIEISCGNEHSLALNKENNVFSWGNNVLGEVGCGEESGLDITRPVLLKQLPKIKSIHCYSKRSFAVTFDGLVYSWGSNYCSNNSNQNYCLGHEIGENIFEPKLIIGLNDVISVGFSNKRRLFGPDSDSTYFLTNEGNIYFCGLINSRDKVYQKIPKILETELKFQTLHTFYYSDYSELLALSEETVYYLEGNVNKKTEYKSFFDYCLNERQTTFKTIDLVFSSEPTKYKEITQKLITRNQFQQKELKNSFHELSELGSGGFGKVIKVQNKTNKQLFALKIIEIKNKYSEELIKKEIKLLKECSEEFVAKYFNSWTENNNVFIQMELFSNNLKNIIEEKRKCFNRQSTEEMTITEYLISSLLMKELLECVQFLHEKKPEPIIHRDLKPANILVNYKPNNGRFLKLCDFGLATFDNQLQTVSHTANMGTLKYVSPEVLNGTDGRALYSTKSDIFSLGFILCELFDLDINSSGINEKPEELKEKWTELEKHAVQMLTTIYRQRPNCSDLLFTFEMWGIEEITKSYKKSKEYTKSRNQMKKFKNQFFYNYFIEKALF